MGNSPQKSSKYWYVALLLSGVGIAVSFYLAVSHYKNYVDPQYNSFCAISKAINCDTVAQSPWSIFLGLPVAWWGVLFFLSFSIFLILARLVKAVPWGKLFFITIIAAIGAVALGLLSVWKIHSICILCFTVYGVTFLLTYTCGKAYQLQKKLEIAGTQSKKRKAIISISSGVLIVFLAGILVLYQFLPRYWQNSTTTDISNLTQGLTANGHPWIGAAEPEITISMFSDYQCFQCAKMHHYLIDVLKSNDKVRLIARQYPLDHDVNPQIVPEPFHVGSAKLAKIGILAAAQNTFWSVNEVLYTIGRSKEESIKLTAIAEKTNLKLADMVRALDDPIINEFLRRDIYRGMKLGITGTPTFVIGGAVYQGEIPKSILKNLLIHQDK